MYSHLHEFLVKPVQDLVVDLERLVEVRERLPLIVALKITKYT